jgi:hypothetical protein
VNRALSAYCDPFTVTNRQLARIHAAVRVRLRLRQQDVADAAGLKRWKVSTLESERIDQLTIDDLRRSFEALGARLELSVRYRGAELDRLLDEVHATLVGAVVGMLKALGWLVRVEVSYSVRGERGSIDVLAWHPADGALLVVEVKSEVPGVDPLLRPLDVKVRLAPVIAREQFNWRAASVSRLVLLPEDSTARRQVARHASVLDEALPARSREVRRWLRQPRGAMAGLWFLSLGDSASIVRNPSAVRRVQRPRSRTRGVPDRPAGADIRLIDPHNVGLVDN